MDHSVEPARAALRSDRNAPLPVSHQGCFWPRRASIWLARVASGAWRGWALWLVGVGASGCVDAPVNTVVRTDSAGIEMVRIDGPDAPLGWEFERLFTVGGEETGPESFYQRLGRGTVSRDPAGGLYVLDVGAHRVVRFDGTGEPAGTLGQQGGGPGEIQRAGSLVVGEDGTVRVYDFGRGAFVRWSASGVELEPERLGSPFFGGYVDVAREGVYVSQLRMGSSAVVLERGGEVVTVASMALPEMQQIRFSCVGIPMSPVFSPNLSWSVGAGVLAAVTGVPYSIELYREGRLERVVRRSVEPVPATAEMARRVYEDGMTVQFEAGQCVIPGEEIVEKVGYAESLQSIPALMVAPDGRIWARRSAPPGEEAAIDVLTVDGGYEGTLPPGSPWPAAFLTEDRIAAVERDDMDVERVVVYRIDR